MLGTFTTPDGSSLDGGVAIADGTIYATAYLPVKEIIAIRPNS
jgi:hypothetical protein